MAEMAGAATLVRPLACAAPAMARPDCLKAVLNILSELQAQMKDDGKEGQMQLGVGMRLLSVSKLETAKSFRVVGRRREFEKGYPISSLARLELMMTKRASTPIRYQKT